MIVNLQQIDILQKNILKDLAILNQRHQSRQRLSKVKTESSKNNVNTVIQFKPSSKEKKGFILTKVQVQRKIGLSNIYSNRHKKQNSNKQNNTSMNLPRKKNVGIQSERTKSIKDTKVEKYKSEQYLSEKLLTEGAQLFVNQKISQEQQQQQPLFEDSLQIKKQNRPQTPQKSSRCHYIKIQPNQNIHISKIIKANQSNKQSNSSQMECTFKPAILKKSKQLAQKLPSSFSRLTTSRNKTPDDAYREPDRNVKKYSEERIKNLSRPRILTQPSCQNIDQQQYPFKPTLSKKSLIQFNNCYLDVIGRNELWLQQRQLKISKLREEEQQQRIQRELQQQKNAPISFTNEYKKDQEVQLSKFVKDGLMGYFQRVQHAQDLKKREKQAQSKYSGRGWNGGITKAKQFKLSGMQVKQSRYRSRTGRTGQREYEKAIKQLHDKILKLDL